MPALTEPRLRRLLRQAVAVASSCDKKRHSLPFEPPRHLSHEPRTDCGIDETADFSFKRRCEPSLTSATGPILRRLVRMWCWVAGAYALALVVAADTLASGMRF